MNMLDAQITTPEDAKTAIQEYIDNRLREWAEWFKKDTGLGIGYPPCSIEYRLMTEGFVVREYLGLKPMPVHANAEEIEVLIREMTAQNRKMAEVLKYYYLHSGGIRQSAHQLGMSHTQFEMQLNLGRWWLAGRLSTKFEIKKLMRYIVDTTPHNKEIKKDKQNKKSFE
jgi:hypothetical protein